MCEEHRIRELAERFRKAILKCDRNELPLSLADFPTGSCADASILLGTYLKDNGIDGFVLIKGRRGEDSLLETHYWLEKGNMLVDITADQFEGVNDHIIITRTDSTWYSVFEKLVKHEADYHVIAAKDVRKHLEAVYDYILEMDKQICER